DRKKITQPTWHTRLIYITTCANSHNGPSGLRRCALPISFGGRIVISGTGFTPAAVVILATLQPIASTQNPILSHVLPNRAQPTQHLPCPINIIYAPTAIPRAVVFLCPNEISERFLHTSVAAIEVEVTQKFERARSQIAAGRIQNRVVIGEGHIFQPAVDHVLVERGPSAVATLKAQLPSQSAFEQIFVGRFVFRTHEPQRH